MKNRQLEFYDENPDTQKISDNIKSSRIQLNFILDNVSNIGNVGMIFRIADALRIKKIFLYNYSDKINPKKLAKTSRSTINYVEFEYISNINDLIKLKANSTFIALEKTELSINYKNFTSSKETFLIIGAENMGVSQELLNLAETSLHLPMNGFNTSINVATATAVVAYELSSNIK